VIGVLCRPDTRHGVLAGEHIIYSQASCEETCLQPGQQEVIMNLTKGQWVTIIAALGAVILTGVVHVGIREWYQPDVRYEEGSWYKSSGVSVGSLKLRNAGHSDAQNTRISASFDEILSDIATSDPGVVFKITSGGIGQKTVTGVVERLVPDETIYIYFATNPSPLLGERKPFVASINFDGGKGKTGTPLLTTILLGILGAILGFLSSFGIAKIALRRSLEDYSEVVDSAIRLGALSALKGMTLDQLDTELEQLFGSAGSAKRALLNAAKSAYQATGMKRSAPPISETT
jgi:hypothetical protein